MPSSETVTGLEAPTPDELRALVASGRLIPGTPEFSRTFANLLFAMFIDTARSADFDEALRVAAG